MAAFTDLDDLVNKASGGSSGTPETVFGFKRQILTGATSVPTRANQHVLYDAWRYQGIPDSGTVPGTVAAPTRATAGAIQGWANAGGAREKFLTQFAGTQMTPGGAMLYDRLLHIGGLDGTVTTAQTVGGTLTRNTGGEGNQIWFVKYGNSAAGVAVVTASYTNQDGTASRTTQDVDVIGSTNNHEVITPLPLQAGDTGVQAVASITIDSTLTATTEYGVVIARPLAVTMERDGKGMLNGGYPLIEDDSCLALALITGYYDNPFQYALTMVES